MKRFLPVLFILLWAATSWGGMQSPRRLVVAASGGAAYTDDFNRANENPISSPWQKPSGVTNAIQIYNSRACGTGQNSIATYNATFSGNQYVQVDVPDGNQHGVVFRTTGIDNFYLLHVNGNNSLLLGKQVSGAWSTIQTISTDNLASGATIRAEISGTAITVKVNGSTVWTGNDSSLSSGNPGIWANDTTNTCVDNWSGGDL